MMNGTTTAPTGMMNGTSQAETHRIAPDYSQGKRLAITVTLCLMAYISTRPTALSSGLNPLTRKARSDTQLGFWNAPEAGEFTPGIVWLLSYPNSGTSFTMVAVERASDLSTATNYGDEVTAPDDYSISIYPRHEEGPFWEGLSGKIGAVRHLPDKYVLVKTHCGSRCIKCPPQDYVETYESFLDACRLSSGRVPPDRKKIPYLYSEERVKKVVHVIRSPFGNTVSRFHQESKNYKKKGSKDWLKAHPSNPYGFQKWCWDIDDMYGKEEVKTFEYDLLKQIQLSPCHAEIFKYVQWHNLAFQVTKKLGLESRIVHYEEYEDKPVQVIDELLDFMELSRTQDNQAFKPGHTYAEYFTFLDKRRIRLLVEEIASPTTWENIKHYFDRDSSFFQTHLEEDQDPKKNFTSTGKRRVLLSPMEVRNTTVSRWVRGELVWDRESWFVAKP